MGTTTRAAVVADNGGGRRRMTAEDNLQKDGGLAEQRGTGTEIGQFGGR